MKVYVIVNTGCCDSLDSIYSTKALAEAANVLIQGEIDEYEIDKRETRQLFVIVEINEIGTIKWVSESSFRNLNEMGHYIYSPSMGSRLVLQTFVQTSDRAEAIKIANARCAKLTETAEWKEGLVTCL